MVWRDLLTPPAAVSEKKKCCPPLSVKGTNSNPQIIMPNTNQRTRGRLGKESSGRLTDKMADYVKTVNGDMLTRFDIPKTFHTIWLLEELTG